MTGLYYIYILWDAHGLLWAIMRSVHAAKSSAHRLEPEAGVRLADRNGSVCGSTAIAPLKQEILDDDSYTTTNHGRPVPQSVSVISITV